MAFRILEQNRDTPELEPDTGTLSNAILGVILPRNSVRDIFLDLLEDQVNVPLLNTTVFYLLDGRGEVVAISNTANDTDQV